MRRSFRGPETAFCPLRTPQSPESGTPVTNADLIVVSGITFRHPAQMATACLSLARPIASEFHARVGSTMLKTSSHCETLGLSCGGKHTVATEIQHLSSYSKAIIANLPVCLILMDLGGTITSVNPAAEAMLGYCEAELAGHSILVLHDTGELSDSTRGVSSNPAQMRSPLDVLTAKPKTGIRETAVRTYICADGTRLPVQVIMSPVRNELGCNIALMASFHDLTDRMQVDQYIYHLAYHDPLTGLPGRDLLQRHITEAIEQNRIDGQGFALVIADLDHFRRLNDSLGHERGDQALREIAARLQKRMQQGDTVARCGGDEFVLLLKGVDCSEAAEARAVRALEAFQEPLQLGEHKIRITASVGLSFHNEAEAHTDLLRDADIALYESKMLGRNGLSIFTPEMAESRLTTLKMESALREALERNEFFLVYQPQVCLKTGKVTAVEALIRWKSTHSGLVMPATFIPVAEESGLIVEIGAWCLHAACHEVAALQQELGYPISVAVNLSPKQVHAENFQATVESALAQSGLCPSCLELEITEGLLMSHSEKVLGILEGVQTLGITLAIDDFGTGFSNFSYITRFKVDRLKIDRSFVSRCLTDRNSMAVITAIVALARSLNLNIVAEGVETDSQAALLRRLCCDSAQGYLYAAPLSIVEVCLLIRSDRFARDLAPAPEPFPERKFVKSTTHKSEATSAHKQKSGWAWGSRATGPLSAYNPFEPRDPVSRPASPARISGAARPIFSICREDA